MGKITGTIVDGETGKQIAAKVQVLDSTGRFAHPPNAILKVGPGVPFFYSDGAFEVDVPRGPAQVLVERGTECIPERIAVDVPSSGTVTIDVSLDRWTDLGDQGWHPGNTHIHYGEKEQRPDERLQLDPRVEDLRMTAVSILKRWDVEYATNKYTPGMLTEFSSGHHYVQCGEENRHDAMDSYDGGYGHIMLLNIRNVVDPVSRGLLVDAFNPDYPPLSYACDDARDQDGIVIWCHNGRGMEAPVAAALGKVDAFNLFDPHWNEAEYDIYYQMLNAGIKLPASTGSDWFICSANRVYTYTGAKFQYESWLDALKEGRSFITNGPSLVLSVDGHGLGETIHVMAGDKLSTLVTWKSYHSINLVEVVRNGKVIANRSFVEGSTEGCLEVDVEAESDGWIVARLFGRTRDSFFQPVFAHTSPVYIETGRDSREKQEAARGFDNAIERSLEWVRTRGKYYTDTQRREVSDLFRQGQQVFKEMLH